MLPSRVMCAKRSLEKRSASRQIGARSCATASPGRASLLRATAPMAMLVASCLAFVSPAEAAPSFRLVTDASAGNYVSEGQPQLYTTPAANVFPTVWDRASPVGPDFFRLYADYGSGRFFGFDVGTDGLTRNLSAGEYVNAERASFASAGHPGLDLFMDGRGCNEVSGSFVIHSIAISANQEVGAIDVSFTHLCEGQLPSLVGRFTYNASGMPIPPLAPYEMEQPRSVPTLGWIGEGIVTLLVLLFGIGSQRIWLRET